MTKSKKSIKAAAREVNPTFQSVFAYAHTYHYCVILIIALVCAQLSPT
jgi:hypothetical protein